MADLIVGICRFSFLGRGDWAAYNKVEHGSDHEAQVRAEMAAMLYDDARMAFRFQTFERLTLPSIAAQNDPDFVFLVLTSAAMPRRWLDRLRQVCARVQQVQLVVSRAKNVDRALEPELERLREDGRHRLVQFRLDDDDCLAVGYTEHLRRVAHALRDHPAFTFSLPKAAMVTNYPEQGIRYYQLEVPFHSAGAAMRTRGTGQTIFSVGHLSLMRRALSVMENDAIGSLQLKFLGNDSKPVEAGGRSGLTAIGDEDFGKMVRRNFPFVRVAQINRLIAQSA